MTTHTRHDPGTAAGPSTSPTPLPGAPVAHARLTSALGDLTVVVATSDSPGGSVGPSGAAPAVTGLYFPGHGTPPDSLRWGPPVDPDVDPAVDDLLARVAGQLADYLDGRRRTFDLPVRLHGSAFSLRLWGALADLPYGTTTTYGALGAHLGLGPRAVGRLVGANPVSIVVPCHRVVGHDGGLTGYAGGLERKRYLLDLETGRAGLW